MNDLSQPHVAGALPEREASPAEVEVDWDREIARRVAAYERGESTTYPAADVFAAARRLAM